eukprot:9282626-Prorocentrum_lima.AAC.1
MTSSLVGSEMCIRDRVKSADISREAMFHGVAPPAREKTMDYELSDAGTDCGITEASEDSYADVLDKNCKLFKWNHHRDFQFPTTNKKMITTVNPNAKPHLRDFYNFLEGFKCPYGDVRDTLDKGCEQ